MNKPETMSTTLPNSDATEPKTTSHAWRTYALLIALVVFWALNIPLAKMGMAYMSPIWLTIGRLAVGTVSVFALLIATKQLQLPKRRDLPLVISIGVLQMAIFQLLINLGMMTTHAGRAGILIYSTPLWVTPIAILLFSERLTMAKLLGLLCGIAGILVLFSPSSFNWHDKHTIIGNLLLLLAAVSWAIAMVHTRYGKWFSPPIVLLPWQLLIGTLISMCFIPFTTPFASIDWHLILWVVILFSGVVATGFGYYASLTVSKTLPVITTSLCMLAVPVLSLVFSDWLLGEKLTFSNLLASGLIIGGLVFITLENRQKK